MTRAPKPKAAAKPARKPPKAVAGKSGATVSRQPVAPVAPPARGGLAVQFGPSPSAPGSRLKGAGK